MMRSATCAHRVLDAVQLFPAPRVRLVEVELDAVEVTRVQRVPLAPHRVVLGGVRRVLLDEVAPHRGVRRGRARRQLLETMAKRRVGEAFRVVLVDQREEERRLGAVDAAPHVGLLRALHGLTPRGHDSLLHAFGECGFDAREALGNEREPLGDRVPVVLGVARHQVEDHPHALHRAAEDADVAQALAGVVLLERELEPLSQRPGGDAVGIGVDGRGRERAQGGPVVLGAFGSMPSGE